MRERYILFSSCHLNWTNAYGTLIVVAYEKRKSGEKAVSTYLSIAAFDVTQHNYDRRDSRGSSLEDTIAGIFDVLVESMFIYGNRWIRVSNPYNSQRFLLHLEKFENDYRILLGIRGIFKQIFFSLIIFSHIVNNRQAKWIIAFKIYYIYIYTCTYMYLCFYIFNDYSYSM